MTSHFIMALPLALAACVSAPGPLQESSFSIGSPARPDGEFIAGGDFAASGPRHSPDGTRIAFTARRGGKNDIAVVPSAGGPPTFVTSGGRNRHPAWSPDGSKLVYISHPGGEADLYVMPARGGEAVRITHSGAVKSAPDWSPDGRTIAYSSNEGGNWNIWSVPASGEPPRKLTTHAGDEWNPRYSPDGRFILFSTNWEANANIDTWMIGANGGEPIRLTSGPEDEVTPAWSPDGRRIALLTDLGGLFIMNLESGERTLVAAGEGFDDILSWSPDGRWIVVGRNPEPYRLFEIDLGGGEPRPLGLGNWDVRTPDLSRGDSTLAFAGINPSANVDVWLVRDPVAGPTQFTRDAAHDLHPAWSPSGSRIAFKSTRAGGHGGDIWAMPAAGGAAVRLTSLRSAHRPRWCSEELIVFHSDRGADGQPHVWAVEIGKAPRQLTRGRRESEPDCVPATGDVLYSAAAGQGSELFRTTLTGSTMTQLTHDGASARFPRASPDGSSIAFLSSREAQWDIFLMPMSGGAARRLTSDGGEKSPPAWSADGRTIVYSVKRGESQIRRYQVPSGSSHAR